MLEMERKLWEILSFISDRRSERLSCGDSVNVNVVNNLLVDTSPVTAVLL